jgi:hypothetical protein
MEMHTSNSADVLSAAETARRDMQLRRDDRPDNEVPENAVDSSEKVTQASEPIELTGELATQHGDNSNPGIPLETVDNIEQAGLDSTRNPDWETLEKSQLPPEPTSGQLHKDEYWEERSEDRELQDKDLQEEAIREDIESFDQSAQIAEDFSRANSNEVLDPYYRSGSHPANPPSAGSSLDSFA